MTIVTGFSISFAETFPAFPDRTFQQPTTTLPSINDTRTIAILGAGKRTEIQVTSARGNGSDGLPQNYNLALAPSGRFFATNIWPIDPATLTVFRGNAGATSVAASDFFLDPINGYIVLYHPLTQGEELIFNYISFADINQVRGYLPADLQTIYATYGEPSLTNTISAAANIAFANGAARLLVVQGDHTGQDPYWFGAYSALETQLPWIIVPMQNGQYGNLIAAGVDHVNLMSQTSQRGERFLIAAELDTPDISTTSGDYVPRSAITSFNSEERMIFVGIDYPVSVIEGQTVNAGGGFTAAAVAGLWSSFEYVAQPLTNQTITEITPLWPKPGLYSVFDLKQLVADGITLIQLKGGVGSIYQACTTTNDANPIDEEPSIWRIRDYVAINLRTTLENLFVGQAFVPATALGAMTRSVTQQLQAFIDQNILAAYDNVRVTLDPIEPRQADISFDAEPVFPLNGISIQFNVVSSF